VNKEKLDTERFINILTEKANGRQIKSRLWSNYPNSIFYYWIDDNKTDNEIAIYTSENAWGIYI
jgi:hypothetical protein